MARTETPVPTDKPIGEPMAASYYNRKGHQDYRGPNMDENTTPLGPPPALPAGYDSEKWEDVTPKSAGQWEDVTPRPSALVALDGTRHTTDKAIQALEEASRTGYGAEHFAGEGTIADPGTPGYQHILQTFRQSLDDTPGLYAYASRTKVHASAVAADAEKWSAVEKFLSGRIDILPVPPDWTPYGPNGVYDPGMADYVRLHGGLPVSDAPPVWMAAMAQGSERAWLSLKSFAQFAFGPGLSKEQKQSLAQSIEETALETQKPIRGIAGPVSAGVAKVASLAPQMAGLAVASLAGPEATFAAFWAQGIGNLKLAGVDDVLAMGGGFVSASMGTWLMGGLLKSLLPRQIIYDTSLIGVMAMRQAIKNPSIISGVGKFGRHAIFGYLGMLGMGLSDSLTIQAQQGKFDGSKLFNDAVQTSEDYVAMLPYAMLGPLRDHFDMRGKWLEAHADSMRIGSGLAGLNATKLAEKSPQEAKQLMGLMGSRPIYLDPKVVESAARVLNVDPAALARQMTGRAGALEAAQNSNTPLRVPGAALVDLKDHPQVAENAKFEPDGVTLKEAQKFPIEDAELDAFLAANRKKAPQKPLTDEEIVKTVKEAKESFQGPLPGTGEGTKPELRRYADDAVKRMTVGEIAASGQIYKQAMERSQGALEALHQQVIEKLAKAQETTQKGVEKGTQATEEAQASARMNEQFARTARLREWLKSLNIADRKPEKMPEPSSAETGLYDIPGLPGVQVEKSLAEKWYSLGEAQRKQAISLYKLSENTKTKAEDLSVKATQKVVEAGDAAQEALRQERLRDLNRAMEQARARAEKENDKIEKYIDQQKADPIRESTYASGMELGVIYDTVMEGLGKRVSDGRAPRIGIDQAINILIDGGDEPGFNVDHLRELSARPRGFEGLLPWEADNLENVLRTVRRLALQRSKTYRSGKEFERDAEITNMDRELAKGSKGGKFSYEHGDTGAKAPFMQKLVAENANADSLLRPLGPWGVDRLHQLDYALKLQSDLQGKFLPQIEVPKELKELSEKTVSMPDIDRSGRLSFLPETVPMKDLWRAARMAGSKDGMAKLSAGFGVPEMEIERWLKEHIKTKAAWDFVDKGWAANDELYGLESVVHAQRSGLLPQKLEPRPMTVRFEDGTEQTYKGGYDPFRWHDGRDGAPKPVSPQDIFMGSRQGLDTPHRFLMERGLGTEYTGVPDISWGALKAHYESIFHDISHSNMVRDTYRMIYDPAFKDMIRNRLGAPWHEAMKDMLKVWTLGHVVPDAGGARQYNAIFREAKGLAAASVFNLNFPVIGGQIAHFIIGKYGLDISYRHMSAGFAHAMTPEGWREAMESPVVGFRNDRYTPKMNQMWQETMGYGPNRYREALSKGSQEAQHLMDTYLSRGFYHAAKYDFLARNPGDEAGARAFGDETVRRAMPSMHVETGSEITRSRQYGLLTMVKNFPNTVLNMKGMMNWETRVKIGEGDSPVWARTQQIGRLVGMAGGLGLGLYLMGHGKQEKEEWWQFAGRTAFTEATYGNPLLHLTAQAFGPTLVGEGIGRVNFFSTPAGDMLDRVVRDVGHLAQRDRPLDKKMWDALDAAGRVFGAPLPPPLLRSAQGIYKLGRYHLLDRNDFYKTPRGFLDELSIAGYGERRTGTPATDLQTLIGGGR